VALCVLAAVTVAAMARFGGGSGGKGSTGGTGGFASGPVANLATRSNLGLTQKQLP
jgi:hypothetical protein